MFPSPLLDSPPIVLADTDDGRRSRSAKTLPQANASAGSLDATGAGVSPPLDYVECPRCQRAFAPQGSERVVPPHAAIPGRRRATAPVCLTEATIFLED